MIAALLLLAIAPEKIVAIRLRGPGETCQALVGEQWYHVGVDDPRLEKVLAALPAEAPVRMVGDSTLTYRCIGGLIYRLQRLGHADVRFVARE